MPYLYVLHIQSNHQKEQQDHKINNNIPNSSLPNVNVFSNVVVIVFFALAPNFNPTFSKTPFTGLSSKFPANSAVVWLSVL